MTNVRNGDAIVAESYLDVRAKLLEVAATLDRIDRASGSSPLGDQASSQHAQLCEAIKILLSDGSNRAQQLQQLFSREYDSDWREKFGLKTNA